MLSNIALACKYYLINALFNDFITVSSKTFSDIILPANSCVFSWHCKHPSFSYTHLHFCYPLSSPLSFYFTVFSQFRYPTRLRQQQSCVLHPSASGTRPCSSTDGVSVALCSGTQRALDFAASSQELLTQSQAAPSYLCSERES